MPILTEKSRKKISKTLKRRYREDTEFSHRVRKAIRKSNKSKSKRKKHAATVRAQWRSGKYENAGRKQSRTRKRLWADPKFRAYMIACRKRCGAHKRQAISLSRYFADPENKEILKERFKRQSRRARKAFADGRRKPTYSHRVLVDTSRGFIVCRSSWEKAMISILDTLDLVKTFKYEPVRIPYLHKKKSRTYLPDFLIKLKSGTIILLEVCAPYTLVKWATRESKAIAAKKFCAKKGWKYLVFPMRPTRVNVKAFLVTSDLKERL